MCFPPPASSEKNQGIVQWVGRPTLDVGDPTTGGLFIPAAVGGLGHKVELDYQDARQLRGSFAPFFSPKAMKGLFVLTQLGVSPHLTY